VSFLLPCPNCGRRSVYEFDFGGEYHQRPALDAGSNEWTKYLYLRVNAEGIQTEWWYHRQGCKRWFLTERDTSSNKVRSSFWLEERPGQASTETTPSSSLGPEH
jgi:heterotetrameric sarcosine oxidase delta subunit